jgi:hypothetical protein
MYPTRSDALRRPDGEMRFVVSARPDEPADKPAEQKTVPGHSNYFRCAFVISDGDIVSSYNFITGGPHTKEFFECAQQNDMADVENNWLSSGAEEFLVGIDKHFLPKEILSFPYFSHANKQNCIAARS